MNRNCKCGGRLQSIDYVEDSGLRNAGHIVYKTVRRIPGVAMWECDKCGKQYTQRLRVPKSDPNKPTL